MPANVESMFYLEMEGTPWHGLGKALPKVATAQEAIEAAEMNWEVETVAVFCKDGGGKYKEIDNHRAIRRVTDDRVYAIMSERYTPLQNKDAFTFFDQIVGEGKAIYHTAGSLNNGAIVWILAQLPGEIRVLNDDVTKKFIVLTNSHDGSKAIRAFFTPVRIVCWNTLNIALKDSSHMASIRHKGDYTAKFQEAAKLMGITNAYYEKVGEIYERMAATKLDRIALMFYTKELWPLPKPPTDRTGTKEEKYELVKSLVKERRVQMVKLADHGAGSEMSKGTVWGAFNSATELLDHYYKNYRSYNNWTKDVWFGKVARQKQRAFELAVELVR